MLCSNPDRALLLAQHHARRRSNLNQPNHTRFFYASAHERFDQATILLTEDQSHRDILHTATSDRNRCESSSYDDAIAYRMRRRRERQRSFGGISHGHKP
jgi:hypothetical protein